MTRTEEICQYLADTYRPHAIIIYGSFAARTEDEYSDFDVLLIADEVPSGHDSRCFAGVKLDAHLYSTAEVEQSDDPGEFIQIFDGVIVLDERGLARQLLERVRAYVACHSAASDQEKEHLTAWCRKMLQRVERDDTEGLYRWHWLLHDSLEIYCQMRGLYYFGPKKTLQWIQEHDPAGFNLAGRAFRQLDLPALDAWVRWVIQQ